MHLSKKVFYFFRQQKQRKLSVINGIAKLKTLQNIEWQLLNCGLVKSSFANLNFKKEKARNWKPNKKAIITLVFEIFLLIRNLILLLLPNTHSKIQIYFGDFLRLAPDREILYTCYSLVLFHAFTDHLMLIWMESCGRLEITKYLSPLINGVEFRVKSRDHRNEKLEKNKNWSKKEILELIKFNYLDLKSLNNKLFFYDLLLMKTVNKYTPIATMTIATYHSYISCDGSVLVFVYYIFWSILMSYVSHLFTQTIGLFVLLYCSIVFLATASFGVIARKFRELNQRTKQKFCPKPRSGSNQESRWKQVANQKFQKELISLIESYRNVAVFVEKSNQIYKHLFGQIYTYVVVMMIGFFYLMFYVEVNFVLKLFYIFFAFEVFLVLLSICFEAGFLAKMVKLGDGFEPFNLILFLLD